MTKKNYALDVLKIVLCKNMAKLISNFLLNKVGKRSSFKEFVAEIVVIYGPINTASGCLQ